MNKQLTGKRRYRVGGLFRNKLILQVECVDLLTMTALSMQVRNYEWQDAGVQDLMTIEASHAPFPIEGHSPYGQRAF